MKTISIDSMMNRPHYINFEELRRSPKTVTQKQLEENKKQNTFFCNHQGGLLLNKEDIEQIAKTHNKKITYDYIRCLVILEEELS